MQGPHMDCGKTTKQNGGIEIPESNEELLFSKNDEKCHTYSFGDSKESKKTNYQNMVAKLVTSRSFFENTFDFEAQDVKAALAVVRKYRKQEKFLRDFKAGDEKTWISAKNRYGFCAIGQIGDDGKTVEIAGYIMPNEGMSEGIAKEDKGRGRATTYTRMILRLPPKLLKDGARGGNKRVTYMDPDESSSSIDEKLSKVEHSLMKWYIEEVAKERYIGLTSFRATPPRILEPELQKLIDEQPFFIDQVPVEESGLFLAIKKTSSMTTETCNRFNDSESQYDPVQLSCFRGVAEGVKNVHDAGAVCGDPKSENLLFDRENGLVYFTDLRGVEYIKNIVYFSGTMRYLPTKKLMLLGDQEAVVTMANECRGIEKAVDNYGLLLAFMENVHHPKAGIYMEVLRRADRTEAVRALAEKWAQIYALPEHKKAIFLLISDVHEYAKYAEEYEKEYGITLELVDMLNFNASPRTWLDVQNSCREEKPNIDSAEMVKKILEEEAKERDLVRNIGPVSPEKSTEKQIDVDIGPTSGGLVGEPPIPIIGEHWASEAVAAHPLMKLYSQEKSYYKRLEEWREKYWTSVETGLKDARLSQHIKECLGELERSSYQFLCGYPGDQFMHATSFSDQAYEERIDSIVPAYQRVEEAIGDIEMFCQCNIDSKVNYHDFEKLADDEAGIAQFSLLGNSEGVVRLYVLVVKWRFARDEQLDVLREQIRLKQNQVA